MNTALASSDFFKTLEQIPETAHARNTRLLKEQTDALSAWVTEHKGQVDEAVNVHGRSPFCFLLDLLHQKQDLPAFARNSLMDIATALLDAGASPWHVPTWADESSPLGSHANFYNHQVKGAWLQVIRAMDLGEWDLAERILDHSDAPQPVRNLFQEEAFLELVSSAPLSIIKNWTERFDIDWNQTNPNGETVAFYFMKQPDVLKWLAQEKGLDLSRRNNYGMTAYGYFRQDQNDFSTYSAKDKIWKSIGQTLLPPEHVFEALGNMRFFGQDGWVAEPWMGNVSPNDWRWQPEGKEYVLSRLDSVCLYSSPSEIEGCLERCSEWPESSLDFAAVSLPPGHPCVSGKRSPEKLMQAWVERFDFELSARTAYAQALTKSSAPLRLSFVEHLDCWEPEEVERALTLWRTKALELNNKQIWSMRELPSLDQVKKTETREQMENRAFVIGQHYALRVRTQPTQTGGERIGPLREALVESLSQLGQEPHPTLLQIIDDAAKGHPEAWVAEERRALESLYRSRKSQMKQTSDRRPRNRLS